MLTPRSQRPWYPRHPVLTATAAAVALWWLWLGWYPAVIFVTGAVFVLAARRRRKAAVIRDAGLRARADYEHQLTLAGDPHGTYGRFPPADWFVTPVRALPPRW
ncbi:MAG: hypothetical protein PGN37_20930 [Mycobacterium kyogaense]|uniref:hypothetical protein n=1 Tax=Mycobacterium kyogaense TaxID=2212479 RepID=UPI002FF9DDD9